MEHFIISMKICEAFIPPFSFMRNCSARTPSAVDLLVYQGNFQFFFFFLTKVKEALHINQTYYTLMRLQLGLSNINSTACICFPQSQHTNLKKDLHKLSSCPNRSSRDKGKKHPSFLLQIPLTLNNCAAHMH